MRLSQMRASQADGWELGGDDAFPCVIASTAITHSSRVISRPAADTSGLVAGPPLPKPPPPAGAVAPISDRRDPDRLDPKIMD